MSTSRAEHPLYRSIFNTTNVDIREQNQLMSRTGRHERVRQMYLSIHLTRRRFVTRAFTTQTRVWARISISRSWPAITGPVGGTGRRPGLLTLQLYSLFGRRQATTSEWHGSQTFPFMYFLN